MVISFSLTAGVLLWQRKNENPLAPSAQPAAALPRIAAAGEPPAPPAATVGDSAQPPPAQDRGAIPTQDMVEQDSSNLVPIEITLRYLSGKKKWEVRLKSASEDSMTVQIRILSAASSSESAIQHTFAAYELLRLGYKDDLVLQTGDQITLQSAPYRDMVKAIGFE
jgi:hypothetical protein